MIRLSDATLLAITKLRARKVRTTFTVIIAGLLFGVVASIIIVSDGVLQSIETATKQSITGRYIVSGMAQSFPDMTPYYTDPVLIANAVAEHKQLVANKKAEAKRLGIEYDPTQDPAPVETVNGQQTLSGANPIALKLIAEKEQEAKRGYEFSDFQNVATSYHPQGVYQAHVLMPKNGALVEMKKGVENFTSEQPTSMQTMNGSTPDINEQTIVPEALLRNYLLKNTWKPTNGTIPVVVSQKRAVALTGYAAPGKDAPADVRLQYIKELRTKAVGKTFEACYRNAASADQINSAIASTKEIEAHKNDKTYQKPALLYATPDAATCGAATIARDVRTKEEKEYAAKQLSFKRTFGETVDPVQVKLTYEVVGVAPNTWADSDMNFGFSVKDVVASLFMVNGFRMAIPEQLYKTMPADSPMMGALSTEPDTQQSGYIPYMSSTFYAEFATADQARSFAKDQSCQYDMSGCSPKEKHFYIAPFGSNSIALDDMRKSASTAVLWVTAIVTIVAAAIAGLTIGRTIADGRRETAVFRAIGFKRLDVSQIYITYTLLLGLLVGLFGVLVGIITATIINTSFWLDSTVQAQLTLGLYDTHYTFNYVGINMNLLVVMAAAILAGLIGMLLPLARNARRNPIRDMRDE